MSENDPTTKPTIETILERISALEGNMSRRFDALEVRLDRIETHLDRVASATFETRTCAS